MKKLFIIVFSIFCYTLKSQNAKEGVKTFTLFVKGNCEHCKERIENAADIKGVKVCTWDETSQIAKITFNSDKVSEKQIEESICKSGHDAGTSKAGSKEYEKLPDCCKYRDKKCEKKQ